MYEKIEALLAQCTPGDAREAQDIACLRRYLAAEPNLLTRENTAMHLTASAWIVGAGGERVLLCWHNIYKSWSWTGGHADGDDDLPAVALREAEEETGVRCTLVSAKPLAVDILPVWPHEKRGAPVSGHLHLNFTFLLRADEAAPLRIKPDENSDVRWFAADAVEAAVSEPDMRPVYARLAAKTALFTKI
jgi:8-oxo-dGTP pyrophosphatase MutT (NUDIX family)